MYIEEVDSTTKKTCLRLFAMDLFFNRKRVSFLERGTVVNWPLEHLSTPLSSLDGAWHAQCGTENAPCRKRQAESWLDQCTQLRPSLIRSLNSRKNVTEPAKPRSKAKTLRHSPQALSSRDGDTYTQTHHINREYQHIHIYIYTHTHHINR